jgi:hypothetical protein
MNMPWWPNALAVLNMPRADAREAVAVIVRV